jgi:hypothetical protein
MTAGLDGAVAREEAIIDVVTEKPLSPTTFVATSLNE